MKFRDLKGTSIRNAFYEFDRDNPHVYNLFKELAFKSIDAKKKKTSAKMIINVIRWHFFLQTNTDDEFRINDAFTAHYARKFIEEFPEHKTMFELRKLRDEENEE